MLIAFEGLDNCGKTTMVARLKEYYDNLNIAADFTREFETNIGQEIRKMSENGTLDSVLKAYLFAADRHIRTRIYSEEDYKNKIILFDRYYHSAIAYRMAEGVNRKWIENINSIFRKPDLVFYIDITPEESIKRNTTTKFNIHASREQLQKVRSAYLSIADANHFIQLDGMRSIDAVYNDVFKTVEEFREVSIVDKRRDYE